MASISPARGATALRWTRDGEQGDFNPNLEQRWHEKNIFPEPPANKKKKHINCLAEVIDEKSIGCSKDLLSSSLNDGSFLIFLNEILLGFFINVSLAIQQRIAV